MVVLVDLFVIVGAIAAVVSAVAVWPTASDIVQGWTRRRFGTTDRSGRRSLSARRRIWPRIVVASVALLWFASVTLGLFDSGDSRDTSDSGTTPEPPHVKLVVAQPSGTKKVCGELLGKTKKHDVVLGSLDLLESLGGEATDHLPVSPLTILPPGTHYEPVDHCPDD